MAKVESREDTAKIPSEESGSGARILRLYTACHRSGAPDGGDTHTHTHTHTLTRAHTHAYTRSCILAHTHAHTHSHTYTLSPFLPVTPRPLSASPALDPAWLTLRALHGHRTPSGRRDQSHLRLFTCLPFLRGCKLHEIRKSPGMGLVSGR